MAVRQSHIGTYEKCPYQYKLRVIDNLDTVPNQCIDNALYLGTAIHYGVETGSIEMMKENYLNNYYVITDEGYNVLHGKNSHINELMKIEYFLPDVLEIINGYEEQKHEIHFDFGYFYGTADFLGRNENGNWDLYDFKYSNNKESYLKSPQLHIYKYFLEKIGYKIDKMAFIFIPKTGIRQKKTEDLYKFRKRLSEMLKTMEVTTEFINYDETKVTTSFETVIKMLQDTEFNKNPTKLCDWCEYKDYCLKEIDYMVLPKNERKEAGINTTPDMWLYGDSYSGKTVFMDSFDDVLMLNTDGNVDHITSPVIRIIDEVTTEGRITKRKFAWDMFLDAIQELEKKDNDFKTIVLDLVEDLYEHCRLYTYDKLGVEHEQDAGYGKGWDMVRTEFLSTIKRLKNCGYQVVYISKVTVSEITKKNGEKITTIKPNINDRVANVLAGTVDLTARVVADGSDRYLSFKSDPFTFGGSRYDFGTDKINLNKDEFIEVLESSQKETIIKQPKTKAEKNKENTKNKKSDKSNKADKTEEETKESDEEIEEVEEETAEESEEPEVAEETKKPKRRTRKTKED